MATAHCRDQGSPVSATHRSTSIHEGHEPGVAVAESSSHQDNARLEQQPQHPVHSMQGAFEESMMESHNPSNTKTRDTLDAAARRLQLLELDQLTDEYSSRWTKKSGARYHPLWKIIAQISFGVHLLHRNIAKSEQEVVSILQGHIKEVDAFLEDVTADFELALKDIEERTALLELPLQHGTTFDSMLVDKAFRIAILEGNDIIERIIQRTTKAMKASLKDVSQGCEATAELAKYLERIGSEWTQGNGELLDIMAAMRGNAEGWYRAFRAIEVTATSLNSRLARLDATVVEVARRAGEASRKQTALKEARRQHEKREHARQLRVCRSNPHMSSRDVLSSALSTRTSITPGPRQHHFANPSMPASRHASARISRIDKPLPSVPPLRALINNAHERSVSQPVGPTQAPPAMPNVASTEPHTPDFELPGSVSYFPADVKTIRRPSDSSNQTASNGGSRRQSLSTGRPLSKGYSDKEVVSIDPSPTPHNIRQAHSTSRKDEVALAAPKNLLNSSMGFPNVRSPLMNQVIAEEPSSLVSPSSAKSPFTVQVRDTDESTAGSTRVSSSRGSSETGSKSPEEYSDAVSTITPNTPLDVGKSPSVNGPRVTHFGLFPSAGATHPLHSNRVSRRVSIEVPQRTRRRHLSQETTALPPYPPPSESSEEQQTPKPSRPLVARPSFTSFRGLFAKKPQHGRPIGNGGLGGHSNYAI